MTANPESDCNGEEEAQAGGAIAPSQLESLSDDAPATAEDTQKREEQETEAPKARPDLITTKDALRRLAPVFGGRWAAKLELVDLLRDGRVSLYAKYIWEGSPASIAEAYRKRKAHPVVQDKVRPLVFRKAPQLDVDAGAWDWEKGNFAVTTGTRKRTFLMLCRFSEMQIRHLAGKTGKSRNEQARDEMWNAIVQYAVSSGRDGFIGHKAAMKSIRQLLLSPEGANWSEEDATKSEKTLGNLITEVRKLLGTAVTRSR